MVRRQSVGFTFLDKPFARRGLECMPLGIPSGAFAGK
jgi:hypothetical protein